MFDVMNEKKFELIKNYPKCPIDEGIVVTKGQYDTHYKFGDVEIEAYDVENYPEYWKQLKDVEYIVESFVNRNTNFYYKKTTSGYYKSTLNDAYYTFEELYNSDNFYINSIRRLKDNITFYVGDTVYFSFSENSPFTIKSFTITDGILYLYSDRGDLYFIISGSDQVESLIFDLKHFKPKVFESEDKYDMSIGDIYYSVNLKLDKILELIVLDDTPKKSSYKRFKMYENAEKYLDYNKPKYSEKDIETAYRRSIKNIQSTDSESFLRELKIK